MVIKGKRGKGKKFSKRIAPPPSIVKKEVIVPKKVSNPLFEKRPKNFRIGQNIGPKKDLTRFVKWPKYIRLQRQKRILLERLKVPPPINQFRHAVDLQTARQLLRLLNKYRPETKQAKKARLRSRALAKVQGKTKVDVSTKRKPIIHSGINNVTKLIEQKKASLVVIAHNVDPIELVIFLPALCRKMGIPYCIIKGKSRLGTLVYRKTCTCVALTKVNPEDTASLNKLIEVIKTNFNDRFDEIRRQWGGGRIGAKSEAKIHKMEKRLNRRKV
ncbi:unnamed protein product [Gordionus sp. m RMFG-2023]